MHLILENSIIEIQIGSPSKTCVDVDMYDASLTPSGYG